MTQRTTILGALALSVALGGIALPEPARADDPVRQFLNAVAGDLQRATRGGGRGWNDDDDDRGRQRWSRDDDDDDRGGRGGGGGRDDDDDNDDDDDDD